MHNNFWKDDSNEWQIVTPAIIDEDNAFAGDTIIQ